MTEVESKRLDPRRCDTPENVCGPVEQVLVTDRRAMERSDGYSPPGIYTTWECGWRRWELAR